MVEHWERHLYTMEAIAALRCALKPAAAARLANEAVPWAKEAAANVGLCDYIVSYCWTGGAR